MIVRSWAPSDAGAVSHLAPEPLKAIFSIRTYESRVMGLSSDPMKKVFLVVSAAPVEHLYFSLGKGRNVS